MQAKCALIIPAAGTGSRMKSAVRKPFMLLGGRPILYSTLERFAGIESIVQVVLALAPADLERRDEIMSATAPPGVSDIVEGGATRTESVANALGALRDDIEIVLVHDAVRPFVARSVIVGVIEAAVRSGAAIAAVGVRDTVKSVEKGMIAATLPRERLYLAQTPQGFKRELIAGLYCSARGESFTDDARLVEAAGGAVEVVESSHLNFKITTAEDLELASAVLEAASAGRLHF